MILGWASGTRDTLRNTGSPINAPDPTIPASRRSFVVPTPEERLAEYQTLVNDGVVPLTYVGGFASRHGLGANILFCDGSVRFLKDSIDPRVFRYMGHRADGEIIDGDHY
jgi:prepilin-type processing-associated H-X9-DG protein